MTAIHDRCPDGGSCHHQCPPVLGDQSGLPVEQREHEPPTEACFRVRHCGPLSDVFPRDVWPSEVVTAHALGETGRL